MEWNHGCVSKSERKCLALESEILEAWAILQKNLKQGCCRPPIPSHRLVQFKQMNKCEATEMMVRKNHLCIKIWEFHLVTPPKWKKLPFSIRKPAHVKFRATSCSLPTTLWWYYRGQNYVVVMIRWFYLNPQQPDCKGQQHYRHLSLNYSSHESHSCYLQGIFLKIEDMVCDYSAKVHEGISNWKCISVTWTLICQKKVRGLRIVDDNVALDSLLFKWDI